MKKKILLLVAFLIGCAAPQTQLAPPADSPPPDLSISSPPDSSVTREEFDPQTLKDDDLALQTPARAEAMPTAKEPSEMALGTQSPLYPEAAPPAEEISQIEGFRVQVAALRDHNRAEVLREQIQREARVLAYLHFDKDLQLYKIQAGNSRTAEEARTLRDAVRALGFPEAYLVRTQVQPESRATSGFRVQIFSSSTRDAAENAQRQARVQLVREDIVIDFESPYFKVRVGNVQTRNDAENLLEEVRKKGYETAFIVQTNQ